MAVDPKSLWEYKLDIGDFMFVADGRMGATCLVADFRARANINSSFCLDTMKCLGCQAAAGHSVLHRHDSAEARTAERVVLWLSDQGAPAALPSKGNGGCIAMFRQEYANLREIADSFLARTDGLTIPKGSVIIMSSATQLATEGIFEYILELKSLSRWFANSYEAIDIPGPPLLLGGNFLPQVDGRIFWCCHFSPPEPYYGQPA